MELTKGQKMLITNMINHELKHMDSTVYCYNELTELKQALNIDDVSNQRKLLIAFIESHHEKHHYSYPVSEIDVNEYLSNL